MVVLGGRVSRVMRWRSFSQTSLRSTFSASLSGSLTFMISTRYDPLTSQAPSIGQCPLIESVLLDIHHSGMSDVIQRADLAARAARAGGEVALSMFRSDLPVETKANKTDLVTRADRDAQRETIRTIREEYDEPIIGEEQVESGSPEDEGSEAIPDEGPAWIVDPIDGTNNYVKGLPAWATSIAVGVDGEPIAAATNLPALSDTYIR